MWSVRVGGQWNCELACIIRCVNWQSLPGGESDSRSHNLEMIRCLVLAILGLDIYPKKIILQTFIYCRQGILQPHL